MRVALINPKFRLPIDTRTSPHLALAYLGAVSERRGDEVRVGWVSALAPRPIAWERFLAAGGPLVEAARTTREVQVLEWFAMGEATPRTREADGETLVEFDDLRYGFPGQPRDGLWGVRVRFDPAGQHRGPGERFDRRLPASAPELVGQLWRRTLGAS